MVNPSGLMVSNCGKMRGLVAHLFGVQVVGDTEQPMLCPGLAGVLGGVELVDGQQVPFHARYVRPEPSPLTST